MHIAYGMSMFLYFSLPLQDTDVIVWDIINECGLYRLRGHKDIVTQALFLKDRNLLVTRCCSY